MLDAEQINAPQFAAGSTEVQRRPGARASQAGCLAVPDMQGMMLLNPFFAPMVMTMSMLRSLSYAQHKSPILEGIRRRREEALRSS